MALPRINKIATRIAPADLRHFRRATVDITGFFRYDRHILSTGLARGGKSMEKKTRYHFIDMMEFSGMLMALISHAVLFPFNVLEQPRGLVYFYYILLGIISTSVPLFFLANGFLLFGKPLDLKKHLMKILRMVAYTFLGGAVTLPPIMIMAGTPVTLKGFLEGLWTFRQGWINHLWYMGALVCIYVFFPLLKTAYDNNIKVFCWFMAAAAVFTFGNVFLCSCATVALDLLGRGDHVVDFNVFNMFNPFWGMFGYSFVYFCAGGLIRRHLPKIEALMDRARWKMNAGAAAVIVVFTLCLGLWGIYCCRIGGTFWNNRWDGFDTVFTFVNVLAVGVLCLNYKAAHGWSRAIRLVSENTLGIYIFHMVFSRFMQRFVQDLTFMQNPVSNILFALVVMAVTLAFVLALKKAAGFIKGRLLRKEKQ